MANLDDDDELDVHVRAALKTLDAQVPSGYFDTLPSRTLARLAPEATMQNAGTRTDAPSKSAPPKREEDSGLHDIRALAETAKQRITTRRITPVTNADELIATTTGSFKSLALPQPAQMVSLPELSELSGYAEVTKPAKPAKQAKQAKSAAAPATAEAAAPAAATATAQEAPSASISAKPLLKPAATAPSKNTIVLVAGGAVVAVAAVIAVVVFTGGSKPAPAKQVALAPAPVVPSVQHIDEPAPAPVPQPVTAPVPDPNAGSAAVATAEPAPAAEPTKGKRVAKNGKTAADDDDEPIVPGQHKTAVAPQAPAQPATTPKKAGSDESFDALLKEAGVSDQPQDKKPVLAKKELSADDFKAGIQAITSKAQACYKGTQGMATVKLVIAPTGHISKITVSGPFAEAPEGACVTAAVKGATFPPWDGGSQTMGYTFLLSE